MSLFARIIRKLVRTSRVCFYKCISTAKPEGKFRSVAPVLCEGKGRVSVGEGTVFGFMEDAGFWTSYEFLNPRNVDSKISIGKNCQICNRFTAVSEGEGIEIGDNVLVGSSVTVLDSDFHEIDPSRRIDGNPKTGKVVIGDNVWIGDRVMILKGTTIGKNSVVAAGAVVSGEFPANVVIGGVPARVIREIGG
ncbi:maltose O-acetyltransferase [Fibrobacter sp. UWT3]|uniref:acyltransferase n=1 Tax=Fibrobacter sp. UWT3 TaxID=1896225 RepID=UPI000BCAC749|nr:acyltransferase [Fibrobacter sp. UWT3]SOE58765.1 maltose O-acetyltransferase [Fibrobacter sp. UWT3]